MKSLAIDHIGNFVFDIRENGQEVLYLSMRNEDFILAMTGRGDMSGDVVFAGASNPLRGKELLVSVNIIRPSLSDYLLVEVEDKASRRRFLKGKIRLADMGRVLGTRGSVPFDFELTGLDVLGKTMEVRMIRVPLLDEEADPFVFDVAFPQAVRPFEVDGWQADRERGFNRHKYDRKTGTYEAVLRRWVGA